EKRERRMQHPDEGTIHSWLDGALSADEAARVEAHVKDCPECGAAVAEARGFIAGASRILTALDNAPRGVIPVAAPRKRIDPIVWRVAATLLVVAGGTFAVIKSGGREAPFSAVNPSDRGSETVAAVAQQSSDSSSAVASSASNKVETTRPTAKAAAPTRSPGNVSRAVARGSAQNVVTGKAAAKMGAADMSTATGSAPTPAGPPATLSATPPVSRPEVSTGAALSGNVAGRSASTAEAPTLRALVPASAGSVGALDAASEPLALKVVGRPRQIGTKTTLYEVAPGDTVTLTEIMSLSLEAVVVTSSGVSTARTGDQAREKSVTTQAAKGAVVPAVSASDSQGGAASVPSPAPAQARAQTGNVFTSKTGNVQVSNGVTTISWTDPVTRNVMKLSGRMSQVRLEQVKTQIERERTAEAAKKKP
ncbi:MAG TPA: zf-HC2 domain-containing protein, partial [Gemmatimonadaceae bacterium]